MLILKWRSVVEGESWPRFWGLVGISLHIRCWLSSNTRCLAWVSCAFADIFAFPKISQSLQMRAQFSTLTNKGIVCRKNFISCCKLYQRRKFVIIWEQAIISFAWPITVILKLKDILKFNPLMVFSGDRYYKRYLKTERYFENYSVDGLLSAENRRASLLAKHSYFASPHPLKRLHQIMKNKQ